MAASRRPGLRLDATAKLGVVKPTRRRSAPPLLPVLALLAALLLAQALGLAHRVAHGGAPGAAHAATQGAALDGALPNAAARLHDAAPGLPMAQHHDAHESDAETPEGLSWLAPHEAGSADCRLIDALAAADALCAGVPQALPPLTGTTSVPARVAAVWRGGLLAAYLARAPPQG